MAQPIILDKFDSKPKEHEGVMKSSEERCTSIRGNTAEILCTALLVLEQALPDSQSPGNFVYRSVNRRQKTQSVSHVAYPNVQLIHFTVKAVHELLLIAIKSQ